MKRKAIQLANQTLVVSLPAKWVKQQGIKKGDEIEIEEEDDKLVISTEIKPNEIKSSINLDDYGILRNRVVLAKYLQGVDELELKFTKKQELEEIKEKVINDLIGFEIIKQGLNSVTLKDISGFLDQDFNKILRRIFLIIESMSKELLESLEKDCKDLNHIVIIDKEINKLTYYSIRILNKKGHKEFKKTPLLYSIISHLEIIGDIYKYIAKDVIKYKIRLTKTDLENFKLVNELFILFTKMFFDFKNENLINLSKSYKEIKMKIVNDLDRNKSNMQLCIYCSQIVTNIIMMNNDLLMMI